MVNLSDDDIRSELQAQSYLFFGDAGWGGIFGPTKDQFDRQRPQGWPTSWLLLKTYGLVYCAESWNYLLRCFGLDVPGPREIQQAAQRRRDSRSTGKRSIPLEDESYPELVGTLVKQHESLTPLGDGRAIRTTTSVIQLR